MGLKPLEFSDCVTDSPYFRDNLHHHEKELEKTSKNIKGLINDCRDLISAAKNLSKAQRHFSKSLKDFKFECIGTEQTDDETVITQSLSEMSQLIDTVEEERDRMMDQAQAHYIQRLEEFRKTQFGAVKEGKKKYEKQTKSYYQSLEKHLNLKNKMNDGALNESEAQIQLEENSFHRVAMEYVLLLQETQEKKKFEFVETLLGFMYGWLTFYHQGYDVAQEFGDYNKDLQQKIQNTRESYDMTREEAKSLMNKMLEIRGNMKVIEPVSSSNTKEGYMYLMEKKAFGTTWTKQYCTYKKENKLFSMAPFNQINNIKLPSQSETMILKSCVRRAAESIEKRFCFDITGDDRSGVLTLQALSEDDRKSWMDAMDGKEPIYNQNVNDKLDGKKQQCLLDDVGYKFVQKCVQAIETRGKDDQGLYRIVGVNSKVQKLIQIGLDKSKIDKLDLSKETDYEIKTITSALKSYFRSLPEPVMTFKLHTQFISAAKKESKGERLQSIHKLVHLLPENNLRILEPLIGHLRTVSDNHDKNLMNISNLGVCFGPTLLRDEEETMAAIMDIKFCNIVVEILIENFSMIFKSKPGDKPQLTEVNGNALQRLPSSNLAQKRGANQAEYYNFSHAMNKAVGGGPMILTSKPSPGRPTQRPNSSIPVQSGLLKTGHGGNPKKLDRQTAFINRSPGNSPRFTRDTGPVSPSASQVRTLYACEAENESELSFEPNQIINNVRKSKEPGWLEGTLNGRLGLIPENYVEFLN